MPIGLTPKGVANIGAVALALTVFGAACSGDDDEATDTAPTTAVQPTTTATIPDASTTTPPITTSATTTTAATATTAPTATATVTESTAVPAETTLVNVYWGWSVQNPAAGSPERIGAGARDVAAGEPVRNILEAMFDGLNPIEQSIGMTTSIPSGTNVLGIAADGTTATVDLSAEFDSSSGSLDETRRLGQVVFTVTQFDGIDRVKFHIDGAPQDPILSHGFVIGDGLTRDSFVNIRPTIMIEQPYPGAEATEPLVIRGESNTFEANVRYAVTSGDDDESTLMTEGFTTATAGNGTWGTFEAVVDFSEFSNYQAGPGAIIMWEDSPEDGSQLSVVKIPIILPER